MKDHPLAELFPLMEEADLSALAEDIKQHGLRAPITVYKGMILDGRNRFRACKIAKVEIKTRQFENGAENAPLDFVLSVNLHRRHLTESQRALVAAKIAKAPKGRQSESNGVNSPHLPTITEAAKLLNVSAETVKEAKKVLESKPLTRAVEMGDKSVHAAVKEIKAKKAEKEVQRDSTGYAIPEEIMPLWQRRGEVQEILTAIGKARGALRTVMDGMKENGDDVLYTLANVSGAHGRLNDAWTTVSMALPYAVCPTCQGRTPETCRLCKGGGFIPKHTYENAISSELRTLREKSCVK